jgi:hypothetical protein
MGESEHALLQTIVSQNQTMLLRMDEFVTKDDLMAIQHSVQKHDDFINGNGTEGAKSRLNLLELSVRQLTAKIDEWGKDISTAMKTIAQQVINRMALKLLLGLGAALVIPLILWVTGVIYEASILIRPTPIP